MQINSERYELKKRVSIEAFNKGCLIFSPETGKWYTPREFLDSNEKVEIVKSGMKDFYNVNLFFPKHAIEGRLAHLRKAQHELDNVLSKALDIFDFKPAESKTKKT